MKDIIFIGGSPGTGKTTISRLLHKKLKNPPIIDLGVLREFHLNRTWLNQSKKEEQMTFENLVFILKNYIKYGYKNIIVNDLRDYRIEQIPRIFSGLNYIIISLIVKDKDELKRRIIGERDSGFKNVKVSLLWNQKIIKRKCLKNEFKIDNTHSNPKKTINTILNLI